MEATESCLALQSSNVLSVFNKDNITDTSYVYLFKLQQSNWKT